MKKTNFISSTLIVVSTTLLFLPQAKPTSGTTIVLDGGFLPSEQGWNVVTDFNLPPDVSTDGNVLTINTIGISPPPGVPSGQVTLFYRDVGIDKTNGFSLELILKVLEVSEKHNPFDAGIAFLTSYNPEFFAGFPSDREQLIYFDEDSIGWGDESGSFAIDTTSEFHTYRLTVENNGMATVFVDNVLALQRSGFQTNGIIAFGDQTNDLGVDGRLAVKNISVEEFSVPEPFSALGFLALGALGIGLSLKRKLKK